MNKKNKTCILLVMIFIFLIGVYLRDSFSDKKNSLDTHMYTVPTNYAECVTSASDTVENSDIGLVCEISFTKGEEAEFFKECQALGGDTRELDFENSDAEGIGNVCRLSYYNPSYKFPKDFNECVSEKKGYIALHPPSQCRVFINTSVAINKPVAEVLFEECLKRGGTRTSAGGEEENDTICFLDIQHDQ